MNQSTESPVIELCFELENDKEITTIPIHISEAKLQQLKTTTNNNKWAHDHGELPQMKQSDEGLTLIASFLEAKNESDRFLTNRMNNSNNNGSDSNKDSTDSKRIKRA